MPDISINGSVAAVAGGGEMGGSGVLLPGHAKFLTALNHEIRTPLTGILGMADLLLETALSSEQREYVYSTRLCAENLLESVSNALEYAAVTGGQLQLADSVFSVQEVIRSAVGGAQRRAESRGILLQTFGQNWEDGEQQLAVGDAVRLRQILSILLSHAIKNCLIDEVSLAVSAFPDEVSRRLVLTVTVCDNGPGVPDQRLAALFEPPETDGYNYAGLELGLPLASRLVLAMGGTLVAEPLPGAGTPITMTIPFQMPDLGAETSARGPRISPGQKRVLLVEDNDVAQRFMRTVLERKGYHVHVAGSGPAAIDAVMEKHHDVVLMDVQMPGMDGLEATRRIRRLTNGRTIPIIACTANTAPEVRQSCVEAGMDDFLSKPVLTGEIIELISKYTARPPES